jgi:uncharacterized protein
MLELRPTCENCMRPLPPASRDARIWRPGVFLGKRPAGERVVHRPVDHVAHAEFSAQLAAIPPHER